MSRVRWAAMQPPEPAEELAHNRVTSGGTLPNAFKAHVVSPGVHPRTQT